MKNKISCLMITILSVLLILISGCITAECYPPNNIIDNKCCLDSNSNSVCDNDETDTEMIDDPAEVMSTADEENTSAEAKETEQLPAESKFAEDASILPEDVQLIGIGEPKTYLELNSLSAYRSSRDKGVFEEMKYTVRNIGDKKLNAIVELVLENARIDEYTADIKKEYIIQPLEPGEKITINESLGIRFSNINKSRRITLSLYDKYTAPREDLAVISEDVIPTQHMESLEIFTFGPPEYN